MLSSFSVLVHSPVFILLFSNEYQTKFTAISITGYTLTFIALPNKYFTKVIFFFSFSPNKKYISVYSMYTYIDYKLGAQFGGVHVGRVTPTFQEGGYNMPFASFFSL